MSLLHAIARLLVIAAIALAPLSVARAQPGGAAQSREGIALYKKGRRLLAMRKYERALSELDKSLELLPSPNTELLRAHALRELDRTAEAMESYQRVMDDAGERLRSGEKRFKKTLEEAGRWSAVLRAKVGELSITISNAPDGATLTVDGRSVETTEGSSADTLVAKTWHEPGAVTVTAKSPDGREASEDAELAAGATATVALRFAEETGPEPEPEPEPEPAPPPPPDPDDDASIAPPAAAWVAAALGVAGFGVFAGFGIASSSVAKDLDECTPRCPLDKREDADAGSRNQLIANIGLVVGAAGIAAFATIWIISAATSGPDEAEPDDVALGVGPGSIGVVGRF